MSSPSATVMDSWSGDIIDAGLAPGGQLIQDYTYPYAATYSGYVEECTFTFSLGPEQIPGTDWFRDQIIDSFESEVIKEGARMISLKVWEDKTPVWHTDYTVIVTATASPVPWLLIIGAVLLILFIIIIVFTIAQIRKLWYGEEGQPGLVDWMPILMMVVMMGMIMPMMEGEEKK
jgi:hypothetical protein